MVPSDPSSQDRRLLERLSALQHGSGTLIATAESLTGGMLASGLSAAEGSSDWFRGGIVAYQRAVKYGLLRVPEGPVVSEISARTMAESVRELLGSEVACAVTGVGGPETQDGMPVGTVFLAVASPEGTVVRRYLFEGDAPEILRQTVSAALRELLEAVESLGCPKAAGEA